jgi:beta-lactam-binding protein with PASTA domain
MDLPDLVGAPYQDARAELLEKGFQVVVQREPSADQPVDHVVSQNPGPGRVEQGAEVTLVVADPPPTPEPTAEPTSQPTQQPTAEPTQPVPTDGVTVP